MHISSAHLTARTLTAALGLPAWVARVILRTIGFRPLKVVQGHPAHVRRPNVVLRTRNVAMVPALDATYSLGEGRQLARQFVSVSGECAREDSWQRVGGLGR